MLHLSLESVLLFLYDWSRSVWRILCGKFLEMFLYLWNMNGIRRDYLKGCVFITNIAVVKTAMSLEEIHLHLLYKDKT
jgi:hypothetical protein